MGFRFNTLITFDLHNLQDFLNLKSFIFKDPELTFLNLHQDQFLVPNLNLFVYFLLTELYFVHLRIPSHKIPYYFELEFLSLPV